MRTRSPPTLLLLPQPPRQVRVLTHAVSWALIVTERMSMAATILEKRWWIPLRAAGRALEVVPSSALGVEFLGPATWCGWPLWWEVSECLCALGVVIIMWILHFLVVSALFLLLEFVYLLLDEVVCALEVGVHDA